MLLMGFDGLFTRLDTEFNQLLSCLSAIEIPDSWGKVDAVCQARALQVIYIYCLEMCTLDYPFREIRAAVPG